MKFAFLLLLLFQLPVHAETECDYQATSNELLKLSCDFFEIANAILDKKEVVPSRIYHFGKKEYVDKNIAAKTVPEADWDKYIMGDITRYDLGFVRRGLYGTGGLDTNNYGHGEYQALMEITIKEECRKPERVFSLHDLQKDSRFQEWFNKKKRSMKLEKFGEECQLWDPQGYDNKKCEKIVGEFLKDVNAGVIQDHIVSKSFYIRDRNCIENIRGTPSDWLEIFSNSPNLFIPRCNGYNKVYMLSALLSNVIQTVEPIPEATYVKLKENMRLSDGPVADILSFAFEAKVRCDKIESGGFKKTIEALKPTDLLDVKYQDLCR
ncbi:hypothetical protein [Peredibacter starrii]|uniref:Uncharacterized protein n=1 Tax=Peredibacter starrii TaxID=28202 RepID=A0AAX4HPN8_9BACT|nr:hypothetical protein [Peredibacter starrii]WPU65123.1 hypothetical protein SOO65_20715 [Peredibacter starrii]